MRVRDRRGARARDVARVCNVSHRRRAGERQINDESSRLRTVTDSGTAGAGTTTYEYDVNGNTTKRFRTGAPSEDTHFEYTCRDHLTQVSKGPLGSDVPVGHYDYDSEGLRIRNRLGTRGPVDVFYDETAPLEEIHADTGEPMARYHYADDAALRIDQYENNDGTPLYYHQDALGTTTHLTNSGGGIVQQYKVDPWGRPRSGAGVVGADPVETAHNRKIFTGQEYDAEAGLYYYKSRFYDPETGRFVTQDSYLGEPGVPPSLHRYLYVYANPARYRDPTGRNAQEDYGSDAVPQSADSAGSENLADKYYDTGEAPMSKVSDVERSKEAVQGAEHREGTGNKCLAESRHVTDGKSQLISAPTENPEAQQLQPRDGNAGADLATLWDIYDGLRPDPNPSSARRRGFCEWRRYTPPSFEALATTSSMRRSRRRFCR